MEILKSKEELISSLEEWADLYLSRENVVLDMTHGCHCAFGFIGRNEDPKVDNKYVLGGKKFKSVFGFKVDHLNKYLRYYGLDVRDSFPDDSDTYFYNKYIDYYRIYSHDVGNQLKELADEIKTTKKSKIKY